MDRQADVGQTGSLVDAKANEQMNRWTDGWADRQMVIWLDRRIDGQTSLCWTDG